MGKSNTNKDLEEFKYLIDSRNLTSREQQEERDALLKAREIRFKAKTENEVKTAKLMQLKYQMEEYLGTSKGSPQPNFQNFLKTYIDALYDKRKNFASDINITPLALSHILNRHREPEEAFLFKLIHHSQKTFSELCEFNWELWPKVYFQDKVCMMKETSKRWEKSEEKRIKGRKVKILD